MPRQTNIYRVDSETNRYDTINDLMVDVRAADSYQDQSSAVYDLSLLVPELKPGKGILIWVSEEESDEL